MKNWFLWICLKCYLISEDMSVLILWIFYKEKNGLDRVIVYFFFCYVLLDMLIGLLYVVIFLDLFFRYNKVILKY